MSDLRSMHALEFVLGALYLAGVQQARSPALRHSSGLSSSSGSLRSAPRVVHPPKVIWVDFPSPGDW